MAQTKAQWFDIDVSVLPAEAQEAFRMYELAKENWEQVAGTAIPKPTGHTIKFGYNYGKVSFTVVAPSAAKGTLATYLTQMQANGLRI